MSLYRVDDLVDDLTRTTSIFSYRRSSLASCDFIYSGICHYRRCNILPRLCREITEKREAVKRYKI